MGLDMYLSLKKTKYTSSFREEGTNLYPQELNEFETEIRRRNFASRSEETYYQVGYWRKANAIHQWFVDNCADGVDECQDIEIDVEKLKKLKKACEEVLKDHSKAEELLPTQEGFFFGSTEYDDWYFEDVKYTIDVITKVIKFVKDYNSNHNYDDYYEIVYHASW